MTTLQDRLRQVRGLATEAIGHGLEVSTSHKDSIDVAVVGEIKRGKSTFLNALMHSKVFPSRALVCTSAVTVLVDAPAPTITIRYKNPTQRPSEQRNVPAGSDVFDLMMSLVAKALKRKEGFQGNPDAAEIDEVEVGYPNKFATEGIRLVDTPGVNDPDAWREDITYRYLGKADAAIMLLDPQQPLSSSEVSFLRDKVQTRVKRQLLFVLNKSDQVSPKDRDASLQRIRKELKAWVDDPCIYPLAAKPALDAYLAGKPVDKDFADFECALDAFLRRGRAGGLLISRVEHIIDAALRRDVSLRHRLSTLDQEQGHANADLHQMEQLLTTKDHKLQMLSRSMSAWLDSQAHQVSETFRHQIAQWRAVVGTNPHGVRAGLDQLSRDLVTALEDAGERLAQGLIAQFGEQLQGEVGELSAVHMASGHLQAAQFAYAGNAAASDESLSIGSGIAAGMLLGGPFGAVVGGVLGVFLGSQAQAQRQQMEEQRLIAAVHTYLTQLERNSIAQVGALVQGVGASIIPQLCQRLSADIAAESARVQASRRDMAQSASERGRTRNTLEMERQQITSFRERCMALKQDLHHV